jgi:cysteine desulfurase/selenocysteine lyase
MAPTLSLRKHFPIFHQGAMDPAWIYFDSAATSQKPQCVIDATEQFYSGQNANVHRASHAMAKQATDRFEQARETLKRFINAASRDEIIWSKGATESINLVATVLGKAYFKAGDEILISALEHHANIVPWQQVAADKGLLLKIMPVDALGCLLVAEALAMINPNTALVAIGHVSNALGNINPLTQLVSAARQVNALVLIDGAQAVGHMPVDVQALDCDFYVFSGHKMFGPTGVGVLYGKKALLENLPPYQFGGEMIEKVSFTASSFQGLPFKYEAGTPNIAGVLGLAAAATFIEQNRSDIIKQEEQLYHHLLKGLTDIPGIVLWGDTKKSTCIQSFTLENINNQDLGLLLNEQDIALRVGHHCAMPLMETLGVEGTLRISLACYNTVEEIDLCMQALSKAIAQLRSGLKQPKQGSTTATLANLVTQARSWDETYRQIMLAGKTLALLDPAQRQAECEVMGCESQVWLLCEVQNGAINLTAYSPSKIVRGLLAIMFEPLQGLDPFHVMAFDMSAYLAQLGLAKHLSQSRGNGLNAVMEKILAFCEAKQG